MRIVIDARFLGPEGTGLGRYIEQLLFAFERQYSSHEFLVLLRQENIDLYHPVSPLFVKVLTPARWYTIKEQYILPRILSDVRADIVHFGHFNVPLLSTLQRHLSMVVTVHDVIKHEFSDHRASTRSRLVHRMKHEGYRLTMNRAVSSAAQVIVPSEYTKRSLAELYPKYESKIRVIPEGCTENDFRTQASPEQQLATLQCLGVGGRYLLYVGNSYPYKNLDLLLRILQRLPSDIRLVNPCARSIFYDRLKEKVAALGLADRVVLPGYVSDEDLAVLYRNAQAYVFPSLSEGFGLPILEAMAAGVPVISSNAASLPEVGGDACLYADPHSDDDFYNAIVQVLQSESLRQSLIERGYQRVGLFHWDQTAAATLQLYESIHS